MPSAKLRLEKKPQDRGEMEGSKRHYGRPVAVIFYVGQKNGREKIKKEKKREMATNHGMGRYKGMDYTKESAVGPTMPCALPEDLKALHTVLA